ncbi:hypothetical protein [Methanoculleus chikugoensis]|uniref:Uncharacterized protein n=1 Tax=Methanoculleus chikugoensis TaxID=118126 RepID=A0ABN5XNW7_9EURY|nr:hypothetical protein [Methanoculleus chikugoensis]BBL68724.1 hypothetical protein MchiMG62_19050 [Methanoculleus chikugoensis]
MAEPQPPDPKTIFFDRLRYGDVQAPDLPDDRCVYYGAGIGISRPRTAAEGAGDQYLRQTENTDTMK